jgi:NAD(P)H-dependent FMN reductase
VDPILQIIIASTRPGRVGLPVAEWFVERALDHGAFEVEPVDLAKIALPFLDEPNHPSLQQYTHQHTRDWSDTVNRADAYVFVMPEYNAGFNAVLKNALDYLLVEWRHKAVGFVSYGGVTAGTRAVQLLKPVVQALGMMPALAAVSIPMVNQFVDDGRLHPNDIMNGAANAVLDELVRLTSALRALRMPQGVPG